MTDILLVILVTFHPSHRKKNEKGHQSILNLTEFWNSPAEFLHLGALNYNKSTFSNKPFLFHICVFIYPVTGCAQLILIIASFFPWAESIA